MEINSKALRVVVIDDEMELRNTNKLLLRENFPDVEIVGEAASVEEAVNVIKTTHPHIVLLDIELVNGTGFNVLQQCKPYDFKVIFITAYNHFAIKAIKFSALDYILKPVNEYEFVNAIQNAIDTMSATGHLAQYDHVINTWSEQTSIKKIVLRTAEAIYLTNVSDIYYCQSDNSYTTFFLNDGKSITVSRGIKEFEEMLEDHHFFRPHQSFLVNLNWVDKIDKSDGGFVIMKSGAEIPVSLRRKHLLMQKLEEL